MRFLPVNLNAVMVELDNLDQTLALLSSLKDSPVNGVEEMVPAARTILVTYRPSVLSFAELVNAVAGRKIGVESRRSGTLVEIPVRYNGEDLAEVAQILGMTAEEVVRRHTGSEYTVAFTGFAPGFAYLAGGDTVLNVPRRASPRTRIPAGSVGLAGTFSGVYPQASPGGWQIIGTTLVAMWDIERETPALLQPGYRVRFVDAASLPADQSAGATTLGKATSDLTVSDSATALEVLSTGLQTLFQDIGRRGQAGQGVSASGAMDQGACKTANRLAGNPSDAACLETVGGGLRVRSCGATVVAVTGAEAELVITTAEGTRWTAPRYQALALNDGDILTIGHPTAGARCYVAVRGGFAMQPVLGSCSTDTLSFVGPAPLATGDVLAIRPAQSGAVVGAAEVAPCALPSADDEVVLDVVLGPRTDWFTPEAVDMLRKQRWKVTPQSNRVGIRLAGEKALARAVDGELPSEGAAPGAIQVPPSGQPVLFLADHPLTGGYPVIGAVAPYHLDLAGQIPVGAWVRFNPITEFSPQTRSLHVDTDESPIGA